MQTSALPDLAHTDTTPMHWLATAAAMAAVVAAAGLLQPDASASASTPTAPWHSTARPPPSRPTRRMRTSPRMRRGRPHRGQTGPR